MGGDFCHGCLCCCLVAAAAAAAAIPSRPRPLPDADQRDHAIAHGGDGLQRGVVVGLAEQPAALGVPDLEDAAPDLGEHGGGDAPRVRACVGVVRVLGAGEEDGVRVVVAVVVVVAAQLFDDGGEGDVVGDDEDVEGGE